jgi:hypothetical protein
LELAKLFDGKVASEKAALLAKKAARSALGIPEKRAETLFGERCNKKSHLKESLWLSSSKRSVGKLLKQSKICIYTQKEKLFPIEQQFRLLCVNISY